MPRTSRLWLWFLLAGTVVASAYIMLPQNQVTSWIFPAVNTSGAVAAWIGLARGKPRNRSAWTMLAAALSLSAAGDIIFAGYDLFHAEAPFPSVADVLYIAAHLLAAAAVVRLSHHAGRDSMLEAGVLTVPLALQYWIHFISPTLQDGGTTLAVLVAVVTPVGTLIVLFGALRAGLSMEMRRAPARLLVAGMVAWFIPDAYYATASLNGTYVGGGWMDLGWMLMPLLLGAAALHPQMPQLNVPLHVSTNILSVRRYLLVIAGVLTLDAYAAITADGADQLVGVAVLISATLAAIRIRRPLRDMGRRATQDALTGLPNRTELLRRLTFALAELPADGSSKVALLFCDLDRFKDVNDSMGHAAGDTMLVTIAERIAGSVRDGRDVVARLGGDEFVILMPEATDADTDVVAERLVTTFTEPIVIDGVELFPSVSVGVRTTDDYKADPDELLRDADTAMYRAKTAGRGRAERFDDRYAAEAGARLRLDTELRHALANGELECVYHPEIDLKTGRLYALEALVRWRHPTRGLLTPDEFVPHAETHGVIGQLFELVLHQVLTQQDAWAAEFGWRPPVAVNVSPRQLSDPRLIPVVLDTLREHDAPPSSLILEVTETALVDDTVMTGTLADLRAHGVAVAVDDFGTGYSSVSRLADRHWDALKIDRSFVSGIAGDESREGVVRAMIALAHSLKLRAIAEGVEDEATLTKLRELGCDAAQGYHYTEPVDADAITGMIAESPQWEALPAAA
ncbi:bifunctional diguanylate cyclase/phosphodiesterase [Actinoplanes bogorensis]|uniref:Bifunctional diguanylate cyclase/phosphodiesterase n=1 Tax=Paractinoplanes bogorensis TaxID=1610840 RepID=A0ABS5YT51_9ACTN|nr:bifunctional diguanylate cyclase/phosphodiesterase [Actinoplanes bogorensis]MBU2665220.1 bifunctional diguanylate cyclase/phosphodiesterase [Actinoplanes bogorensis]